MGFIRGFPPIARPDAQILILGSMPSRESLARQRYYAHPRNAFWPIMAELLAFSDADDTDDAYQQRTENLTRNGIALWDVLQACFRSGSLDSAIDDSSIVTNDFPDFFARQPMIERIFFNGAKAEALYLRHVFPAIGEPCSLLPLQRLPSTSPANAGMSREQKLDAWRIITE